MKVNDKKELHAKSASELRKMLVEGQELLVSIKLDREQNKLKNTRGIFNTRKNIAIIKTILRGKEGQEEIKEKKENFKETEVKVASKKPEAKETKKTSAKKAEEK